MGQRLEKTINAISEYHYQKHRRMRILVNSLIDAFKTDDVDKNKINENDPLHYDDDSGYQIGYYKNNDSQTRGRSRGTRNRRSCRKCRYRENQSQKLTNNNNNNNNNTTTTTSSSLGGGTPLGQYDNLESPPPYDQTAKH